MTSRVFIVDSGGLVYIWPNDRGIAPHGRWTTELTYAERIAMGQRLHTALQRKMAAFGVCLGLERILVSRDNFALHCTAQYSQDVLGEHLTLVCRLVGDQISSIETYLSDVDQRTTLTGASKK